MTGHALIAAQPWTGEEAREGLIDRAVAVEGTIGGRTVRVIPEPLQKTIDGVRVRSIRVLLGPAAEGAPQGAPEPASASAPAPRIVVTGDDGADLVVATSPAEPGSVRLLVPTVSGPTAVSVGLPDLGPETLALELRPERDWSIHLVHHSHFDFGYTDPQTAVIANQRSYLDSAVELAARTADWPEASRFRWNAEALWAISDWERNRPQARVDEFMRLVSEGSIGLSALPYNLHTDTCSTDELHELLAEARRLRDRYGIRFTSAMQTDVPGQVAGLPDALQEVGVKYLAVAHNWAGRSQPHTNGALNLPRMFRWRTPAGSSVIVWMTDSPHGLAYLEGPMIGFTEEFETVETLFPAYLTALATRGYPFPPGVFGAHGEEAEGRDPYPWDVLHVRTQGFNGDNGPARLHLSELVRRWNDTWESPTLRVSRNEDFFAEAEERYGDELITVEGDWGDWWVEGVGSAAVPLALTREAQAMVTDARSLSQLAGWSGGSAVPEEAGEARAAYDAISMFNEHTWGASNSWGRGDEGYDSGERQWQWKVGQGLAAHQRATDAVEHALAELAEAVPASPTALASYAVADVGGVPRASVARVLVKESSVPFGVGFVVVDARTGETVPHVEEAQGNALHRESGRWITFPVRDTPGFGWARFDLVAADGTDATAAVVHDAADTPRARLLTLENAHLRVEVDERASVIRSLVEKATGREWVDPTAVVGFNGYVYDTYGSSGAGVNHLSNKLAVSDRLELLASRTLARPSVVVERVDDAVEQRLVYEYAADGVDRIRVTLRLRHDEPRLLIENRLVKPATRTKESGYFAFPFAATEPTVRFEVSGGVTGDGLPHIPGAPQHMRAIRNWVTVADGDDAIAWATKDAPLVQPGAIALPYAPFPPSTSPHAPGTVYSWVHNNVWDTNFPIEQGFTATFAYSVGVRSASARTIEGAAIETALALTNPLRVVAARGAAQETGAAGSDTAASSASRALLALDDERVRIVGVTGGDEEGVSSIRLQSFADEPVRLRLEVGEGVLDAAKTRYLGDPLGELPLEGGAVVIELAPFESCAVRLRR